MSVWRSQASRHPWWQRHEPSLTPLNRVVVLFLGTTLLVRVLTDNLGSPSSRSSGSAGLSGAIAILFILMACALLLRSRRGALPTALATLWLCIWTAVAVTTHGASTETLREGVREISVVALAAIVYNASSVINVPVATRLLQFLGFVPAVIALYQLATDNGMDIAGNVRANGTFAHPDSAAMFFAIAVMASIWRYLDNGRRRSDGLFVMLFATALIATFSIDGLLALVAMLVAFGAFHPGTFRTKAIPYAIGALLVLVFFVTPLGAQRVAHESSTSFAAAERGEPNSSVAWRFYKWKTLLPEWERSPFFGEGLGTTVTTKATPGNLAAGKPPHNEYIRYLVESGLVGIITLLWAVTILMRHLMRKWRTVGTTDAGTFNTPALGIVIVIGCLVNSLADNTFLNSPTCYAAALIVFAVLGLPGPQDSTNGYSGDHLRHLPFSMRTRRRAVS